MAFDRPELICIRWCLRWCCYFGRLEPICIWLCLSSKLAFCLYVNGDDLWSVVREWDGNPIITHHVHGNEVSKCILVVATVFLVYLFCFSTVECRVTVGLLFHTTVTPHPIHLTRPYFGCVRSMTNPLVSIFFFVWHSLLLFTMWCVFIISCKQYWYGQFLPWQIIFLIKIMVITCLCRVVVVFKYLVHVMQTLKCLKLIK